MARTDAQGPDHPPCGMHGKQDHHHLVAPLLEPVAAHYAVPDEGLSGTISSTRSREGASNMASRRALGTGRPGDSASARARPRAGL